MENGIICSCGEEKQIKLRKGLEKENIFFAKEKKKEENIWRRRIESLIDREGELLNDPEGEGE